MKKFKTIFLYLTGIIALVSCRKQPEASFTTNLDEYIAGDSVHLINTSLNGNSYQWTMPDGSNATSTNADFLINPNFGFGTLTFILEADSKKEKKSDWASKSVAVIPASFFSIDSGLTPTNFSYRPVKVDSKFYSPNDWWITAVVDPYITQAPSYSVANAYLSIKFPNSLPPTVGTYLLQSNPTLTTGTAYIIIRRIWWEDNYEDFVSLSGQLNVTITNGKVHVVFSNVAASRTINSVAYPNCKISGDITCH